MLSSNTSDDEIQAPNEEAAPIPDTDTNEEATPIKDATPVLNANPLSNTLTITDPTPVTVSERLFALLPPEGGVLFRTFARSRASPIDIERTAIVPQGALLASSSKSQHLFHASYPGHLAHPSVCQIGN